jgi:hypothetical protein
MILWATASSRSGLNCLSLLGISPTTGILGTIAIAFTGSARFGDRAWASLRSVILHLETLRLVAELLAGYHFVIVRNIGRDALGSLLDQSCCVVLSCKHANGKGEMVLVTASDRKDCPWTRVNLANIILFRLVLLASVWLTGVLLFSKSTQVLTFWNILIRRLS